VYDAYRGENVEKMKKIRRKRIYHIADIAPSRDGVADDRYRIVSRDCIRVRVRESPRELAELSPLLAAGQSSGNILFVSRNDDRVIGVYSKFWN